MNILMSLSIIYLGANCSEYQQVEQEKTAAELPGIIFDPELIDFGSIPEGEVAAESLKIGNEGGGTLTVTNIALSREGSFSLSTSAQELQIEPGEWHELTVLYQPETTGETAQVIVDSDSIGQPKSYVPVMGSMAYPAILIEPNPKIFPWIEVGSQSSAVVDVVSSGEVPVTVQTILVAGEGFLSDVPELPIVLQPGERLPLEIDFSPMEERLHEGEIWVGSDAIAPQTRGRIFADAGDGILKGRICDPTGEGWVVGATVYISLDYDGDGIEDRRIEAVTDSEGYYELDGVSVGTHTVFIEKGSFQSAFEIDFPGGTYELVDPECLDGSDTKIAVVAGEFDSIESLLAQFGFNYDIYGTYDYLDLLLNPALLEQYDIVFFNCGMPFSWLNFQSDVSYNLRQYVQQGGSIYASDWAHMLIEATWPARIDFYGDDSYFFDPTYANSLENSAFVGVAGDISGDVVDMNMRAMLGSNIADLYYDLDAWAVPTSTSINASVLVRGDASVYNMATYMPGETLTGVPLAVRFSAGGTVIYTSFHNEPQLTIDMETVLKEIILSL
ncbi:MAG: hypothetical protein CMK59_00035 [Proteobacteria bacterium]|nr:hypothetical protein [Pseudomonadota bacterium]